MHKTGADVTCNIVEATYGCDTQGNTGCEMQFIKGDITGSRILHSHTKTKCMVSMGQRRLYYPNGQLP